MDWAKTTARRDKKRLKFGIRCVLYKIFDGICQKSSWEVYEEFMFDKHWKLKLWIISMIDVRKTWDTLKDISNKKECNSIFPNIFYSMAVK